MNVGALRRLIADLADDAPVMSFQVSTPQEDLNVAINTIRTDQSRTRLEIHIDIVADDQLNGTGVYSLVSTWTEPCDGSCVSTCRLAKDEVDRVRAAISWLEEHAGDEWGSILPSFQLESWPELTGRVELDGLDAVIDDLKCNSRYDEDPTYYGDEPYGPFEARNRDRGLTTLESGG